MKGPSAEQRNEYGPFIEFESGVTWDVRIVAENGVAYTANATVAPDTDIPALPDYIMYKCRESRYDGGIVRNCGGFISNTGKSGTRVF